MEYKDENTMFYSGTDHLGVVNNAHFCNKTRILLRMS